MLVLSETTRLLKALGDENRLRLLHLLRRDELSTSDLVEILNLGQSRVSAHLALLKEVGLVVDRRLGRRSLYSIHPDAPAELLGRVIAEDSLPPEFEADLAGLEALIRRKREADRSYFDRVASKFGELALPGRTWEGLARGLLSLAPRARYADLGVGDGLLTLMLAEVAESVTAVDLSEKMLDQLATRATAAGLGNLEYVVGELDDLPLPDASHDVVVLSQALHHAEDPVHALTEARRILRPDGQLLVLDLLAHGEDWVRDKLQHRHLGFTEAGLTDHLARAGFDAIRVQRVARDPHPPHFMTLLANARRGPV
ncbi:ArsR/SmtB family transcription factor [Engelhardtia mirabilis]|uniref:Putative methyltransferase YcgJ n=1 Tax=Engelhardtia mirabilis TaxID=2528011 RepID=A0A518BG63_9BACT|nr:putative methyltransferase YcgJ [Planctomycetes bacterium Pla133]QDV00300.1 putative methyltransferase YcgJ [Planctomycetes bacterium Pla86]